MSRLLGALLAVSGCAADTFSRTLRAGGAVRDAEYCYTTAGASSMDRCALAPSRPPCLPPVLTRRSEHMQHALGARTQCAAPLVRPPCPPRRLQGRQQEMTTNGLRLEWAQQTELMGQQLSLGLKAVGTPDHAGVTELKLGSSTLDLGLFDFSGDCTHDFERRSTQLDLTMSSAGGTLPLTTLTTLPLPLPLTLSLTLTLTLTTTRAGTVCAAACDLRHGLQEVSAYHRAGPINLQPRWLRPAKLLRVHVGRGGAYRRCPVSMQLDLPLPGADPSKSPEFELKVTLTLERVPRKTKCTKAEVSARKAARKKAAAETG